MQKNGKHNNKEYKYYNMINDTKSNKDKNNKKSNYEKWENR